MGDRAVYGELGDNELVGIVQAGDLDAFSELVRRHHGPVSRRARALMGNAEDAQDVTQEVFLAAWKGMATFRRQASFASWVHVITTRQALNAMRRRGPGTQPEGDAAGVADTDLGPAELAEQQQRLATITAAVEQLPPPQSVMIQLHAEHTAYSDIATATGTTPASVRSHLHRARRTLRTTLSAVRG